VGTIKIVDPSPLNWLFITHIASTAFWKGPDAPGFGYRKFGSGEGRW
jgi:hypothetical protein